MSDLIEGLTDIDPEEVAAEVAASAAAGILSSDTDSLLWLRGYFRLARRGERELADELASRAASVWGTNPEFRERILAADGRDRLRDYMRWWALRDVGDRFGLEARDWLPPEFGVDDPSTDPLPKADGPAS